MNHFKNSYTYAGERVVAFLDMLFQNDIRHIINLLKYFLAYGGAGSSPFIRLHCFFDRKVDNFCGGRIMAVKTETLTIKVSPEEKEIIKKLAEAADMTVSKYLYGQIFGGDKYDDKREDNLYKVARR